MDHKKDNNNVRLENPTHNDACSVQFNGSKIGPTGCGVLNKFIYNLNNLLQVIQTLS